MLILGVLLALVGICCAVFWNRTAGLAVTIVAVAFIVWALVAGQSLNL